MKKQRFSLNKLKKIPKNQLLIGGLAGILLLVIAIPVDKKEKVQQDQMQELTQGQSSYEDTGDYGKRLERKLEQVLEQMEGVGNVEVMITLKDQGEHVVEKDDTRSSQDISQRRMGL